MDAVVQACYLIGLLLFGESVGLLLFEEIDFLFYFPDRADHRWKHNNNRVNRRNEQLPSVNVLVDDVPADSKHRHFQQQEAESAAEIHTVQGMDSLKFAIKFFTVEEIAEEEFGNFEGGN